MVVGFYHIVGAMLRRWYIPLFSVMAAGGLWFSLMQDGGCYTSSTVVTFSLDARAVLLPDSGLEDSNVIAFAGMVANEINEGRPAPPYASREAPLYGVGVRRGEIVGLPNSGGQWTNYYPRAEIEIQIVGRTLPEVRKRQIVLLNRAFGITRREQLVNSPKEGSIRAAVLPMTADIQKITPSRTSQLVALAALLLSAILLSGGACAWLDARRSTMDAVAPMRGNESDGDMMELSGT